MYSAHHPLKSPAFCDTIHLLAANERLKRLPIENKINIGASHTLNYLHFSSYVVSASIALLITILVEAKKMSLMNFKHRPDVTPVPRIIKDRAVI